MNISKAVLKEELILAQRILTKWQQRLDEGVPGEDLPAEDLDVALYMRELVAEFLIVAGKMENLASILSDDRN
jgi:hypothetical protein